MFELEILLGNVIAPLAVILFGWLACRPLPLDLRSRVIPFVLAVGSGLAIWLALNIRTGFTLWPEDAWQKVPAAAMIVTVVAMIADLFRAKPRSVEKTTSQASPQTTPSSTALIQLLAVALAAAVAAWLIYPRGEMWTEFQNQQSQWCIVITLAACFGWWGVAGCQPSVASTVGLAIIPLLVAGAFLTSLSIMKVTEPLIAIATVLGLSSLIDLRLKGGRSLPIMIAPALFAMSGFIAHAFFQSYLQLPRTLYFLAMLSPAIVALVARTTQRKSTRFAIGATVALALLLAAAIGIWAYVAGGVGSQDEW